MQGPIGLRTLNSDMEAEAAPATASAEQTAAHAELAGLEAMLSLLHTTSTILLGASTEAQTCAAQAAREPPPHASQQDLRLQLLLFGLWLGDPLPI